MELVDHGGNIENWIQAALRKKQLQTTLEVFYYISVIWTCSELVSFLYFEGKKQL